MILKNANLILLMFMLFFTGCTKIDSRNEKNAFTSNSDTSPLAVESSNIQKEDEHLPAQAIKPETKLEIKPQTSGEPEGIITEDKLKEWARSNKIKDIGNEDEGKTIEVTVGKKIRVTLKEVSRRYDYELILPRSEVSYVDYNEKNVGVFLNDILGFFTSKNSIKANDRGFLAYVQTRPAPSEDYTYEKESREMITSDLVKGNMPNNSNIWIFDTIKPGTYSIKFGYFVDNNPPPREDGKCVLMYCSPSIEQMVFNISVTDEKKY